MNIEPIRHTLRLCGVDCAVDEYQPKLPVQSPPLLMLHGWLDNAATFAPLLPLLNNQHIFTLDFPGHGKSSHIPQGMAYHFLDLVYVIQDLVAHFSWAQFAIVGHSMGGAAASLYASLTDHLSHLILLEALGPLTVSSDETLQLMQRSVAQRSKVKKRRIFKNSAEAIAVRAQHSDLAPELIAPIVERGIEPVAGGVRWSSDPRLTVASINRLTEPQLQSLLVAIKCPVLLIEAEQGLFANNALIQARKKLLKGLQQQVLGGGHHVHLEQPQAVAASIEQFIAD
ncbi:MAG: alpha/beta hydrolase [Gammaproteobacteria bacterium]|nr:alpha/beta hydrolase [Gammaproteobacteria bacterium]